MRAESDVRVELRPGSGEAHADMREVRGQIARMKLFMLGGLVTILAAVIALHG